MSASRIITADGHAVAPLNITVPAPSLNLKGFHWETSDEKLLGPQPESHFHSQLSSKAVTQPLQAPVAAVTTAAQQVAATVAKVNAAPLPPALASHTFDATLGNAKKAPPPPLTQLQGPYAGNGFNTIWRPKALNDDTVFPIRVDPKSPPDNILQLSLTTEQITFGEMIGNIPNRGLNFGASKQATVTLQGFPYLQTVQDVTNVDEGLPNHPIPNGIHFEPGMFLFVPACEPNPKNKDSVVRMASIPHGTTINAQGLAPTGPGSGKLVFDDNTNKIDTTPHDFNDFNSKQGFFTASMTANDLPFDKNGVAPPRIPQDLSLFNKTGFITSKIIKNPNLVLGNAIAPLTISQWTTFVVATGPSTTPGEAVLNGGGTANISFLAGTQAPVVIGASAGPPIVKGRPGVATAEPTANDTPNAHANFMTAQYWIETVQYDVRIPKVTLPVEKGVPVPGTMLLRPTMPPNCTAPTPVFAVTLTNHNKTEKTIQIPGTQIQSSQVVNLNFAGITWPHASVSTVVPVDPQPFTVLAKDLV